MKILKRILTSSILIVGLSTAQSSFAGEHGGKPAAKKEHGGTPAATQEHAGHAVGSGSEHEACSAKSKHCVCLGKAGKSLGKMKNKKACDGKKGMWVKAPHKNHKKHK